MNPRILLFSHEYPPNGGGAGVVAQQFLTLLLEAGYQVDLLTSGGNKIIHSSDFTLHAVPIYKGLWVYNYYSYIKNKIELSDYDYVICNDIISIYMAGLIFCEEELSKSVFFMHGSEPEYFIYDSSLKSRLFFRREVLFRGLLGCKKIVCHSYYMKDKLLEALPNTLKFRLKSKVEVLYFGYDAKLFFTTASADCSFRRGRKFTFISVSRIEKGKGYDRMFRIFTNLKVKMNIDLEWIIVGDGTYLTDFKRKVNASKVKNSVIFTGKVNRYDLIKYYAQADMFWLLSEYKESFGLVYIEAQACGIPAIGNNSYGVKEAILNHKTGLLVNHDYEIYSLLFNKRQEFKLDDMINYSSKFTSEKALGKLLNVLR